MSEMYTTHAALYAESIKDNIYNSLLERPSTMALLDCVKGKDVLDICCGPGAYADWFMQQSINHLTCTDLSQEMVDLVSAKFGGQVRAYTQDISSGLVISNISEGSVDESAKDISESTYNHLKNNPNFIFIRCEKARA